MGIRCDLRSACGCNGLLVVHPRCSPPDLGQFCPFTWTSTHVDLASQSLTALLTQKPPSSLTREQVHTRVHTRTGSSERERGRGEQTGSTGSGTRQRQTREVKSGNAARFRQGERGRRIFGRRTRPPRPKLDYGRGKRVLMSAKRKCSPAEKLIADYLVAE